MTIKNRGGVFGRNPTFNDVDVDGTLSIAGAAVPAPANTLTTSNIGSTVQAYDAATAKTNVSQTFTALQNFNFAGGGNYVATFQTTTTATPYTVNIGETSGSAAGYPLFRVGQSYAPYSDYFRVNSQGNVYASGGVYIGGTAAANELDDYEEGTWTPEFVDSAGANNCAAANGSNGAYYTKIGNQVTCSFRWNKSGGTAVGAYLDGLPFTPSSTSGKALNVSIAYGDATQGNANETEQYRFDSTARITLVGINLADLPSVMRAEFTYFTD
jgi:hypothetical protein